MTDPAVLPRSFLYVPGHRADLIAKSLQSAADAVVFDLEDAVPASQKDLARSLVSEQLSAGSAFGPDLWVRVNSDSVELDLGSIVHPGLSGIFIAKCDEQKATEVAASLAGTSVTPVGLIETAAALRDIDRIAAAGVAGFAVGLVDLLADLRISAAATSAVDGILLHIVVASAAAGLHAPIAPTQTGFRDLEAFRESSHDLLANGFRSRTAVHPTQVPIINEVFAPDLTEVSSAQHLLRRFEAAGGDIFVDETGRMVDAAVVRGAREIVDRARALSARGGLPGEWAPPAQAAPKS